MTRTTIPALVAVASTLVLSVSIPALAQETQQVHVGYADLDLAHAPGRDQFSRRIEAAVAKVCGDADGMDLRAVAEQRTCRAAARSGARGQMDVAIAAAARPTQLASR